MCIMNAISREYTIISFDISRSMRNDDELRYLKARDLSIIHQHRSRLGFQNSFLTLREYIRAVQSSHIPSEISSRGQDSTAAKVRESINIYNILQLDPFSQNTVGITAVKFSERAHEHRADIPSKIDLVLAFVMDYSTKSENETTRFFLPPFQSSCFSFSIWIIAYSLIGAIYICIVVGLSSQPGLIY